MRDRLEIASWRVYCSIFSSFTLNTVTLDSNRNVTNLLIELFKHQFSILEFTMIHVIQNHINHCCLL